MSGVFARRWQGRTGRPLCRNVTSVTAEFVRGTRIASYDFRMTKLEKIREIEELGDRTFRRLEFDLVSHYRRHVEDQEAIALELRQKTLNTENPVAQDRVDEILAMLDHVHDPMITSGS